MMFKVSDVSVKVGSKQILSDINLEIHPGTFVAVVGPNGAGKSSLLKVMSREYKPLKGKVILNKRMVAAYAPEALSAARAVLAQDTQVQFDFSVEEIVLLGRHCHRTPRYVDLQVVDEVLSLTNTSYLRDRIYANLSGGEKQRVQLARVMAQVWKDNGTPRYMLLDEPISSLDIRQQQTVLELARHVCKRNIGVFAIIHDLNQAVQYADEIYFLRDGECLAAGPARAVFTKENIEKTFGCNVSLHHDAVTQIPFIIPQRHGYTKQITTPVPDVSEVQLINAT